MGMAVFLPSWWFGLEQPNTGAYRLFGVVVTSWRPHANEYFWELLLPVSLSPWWTIAAPNFCKDPPALAGKVWFSLLWGHCSLPLGSNVHQILCVPSKSGLFPQSCGSPAIKSHWPSKSGSLGIPFPVARPSHWEAWHGAQNLHSSGRNSVI